jgi:hypothetical protein
MLHSISVMRSQKMIAVRRDGRRTVISTTSTAILQRELPLVLKFVKDSCPGVSIISKPGILYSCLPSCIQRVDIGV